jgi:hypothetical protein
VHDGQVFAFAVVLAVAVAAAVVVAVVLAVAVAVAVAVVLVVAVAVVFAVVSAIACSCRGEAVTATLLAKNRRRNAIKTRNAAKMNGNRLFQTDAGDSANALPQQTEQTRPSKGPSAASIILDFHRSMHTAACS